MTGFHRRFLSRRQSLAGVIGGLLPSASTTTQGATSAASQNIGGPVGGGATSVVTSTTRILSSSSTVAPSTPLTPSSPSSTGSTTAIPTPSTPATPSSTTPFAPTHTSAPPASASSGADVVYTSYDGTSVVYVTSTPPASSATSAPSESFLRDPSLEGGVFALVGIVVLIIIFVAVTWTIRKRRRNRLERDLAAAVTFDPGATDLYERHEESLEKRSLSGSSSGHGLGYARGYGMSQLPYAAPQHGPAVGYGQYTPPAVYASPNPAHYPTSSPAVPQPAAQGGANLTRKFSDRKPVPPLLPDPAYDPHVSIPSQFYQQ